MELSEGWGVKFLWQGLVLFAWDSRIVNGCAVNAVCWGDKTVNHNGVRDFVCM